MSGLPHLDAAAIMELVSFADAVAALREVFTARHPMVERTAVAVAGGDLLVMPAVLDGMAGVKTVMVQPSNAGREEPVIQGSYLLVDAVRGRPVATLDGAALTLLRTPAASALATQALAVPDAKTCVIIGTGPQGLAHEQAMRWAVPALQSIMVVGRNVALETLVGTARIICTCTSSPTPLFAGRLVAVGTHLNAIGAYHRDRCELDSEVMNRASIVVDDHVAARAEAGDIVVADAWAAVIGDLHDVVCGRAKRTSADEITVFKSVGVAIEDLAVATLAAHRAGLL